VAGKPPDIIFNLYMEVIMVKSIDLMPEMYGDNLLKWAELSWLQEMLSLAIQAESSCFLMENCKNTIFCSPLKRKGRRTNRSSLMTAIGQVICGIPIIRLKDILTQRVKSFKSNIFQTCTGTRLAFNASLAWRFLEGMATGDFCEARQNLLQSIGRENNKRLASMITEKFQAKRLIWDRPGAIKPDHSIIWIDKVNLRRQGQSKNFRLYLAAGLRSKGKIELLAVQRSANVDDYISWKHLFEKLREKGYQNLPPVTGTVDCHALKGLKEVYPDYKQVRPSDDHIRTIFSLLPEKCRKAASVLSEDMIKSTTQMRFNLIAARFFKNFALTEPRLVIDFFNPGRTIIRLNKTEAKKKTADGADVASENRAPSKPPRKN
jgi:hypothetical protein